MRAPQPSPSSDLPPPDVPHDPKVSDTLANYLRTFALWARNGFANKLPANTALPGVMLQAFDAAPGATPAVWMLRVQSNGSFVAHQVSVGGPNPTTTVT
jgi:hypothetical protein